MAKLDDLLPELKDDVSYSKTKTTSVIHMGKKRRVWLEEEAKEPIDAVFKPLVLSSNKVPQSEVNLAYKSPLCFADLRSNPLQLFKYLFELAQKADEDYKTPRVKLGTMMLNFNMSKDSARTALRFLLKQGFVKRIEFQAGNMGWSRYQLDKDICKELKRGLLNGFIDPFKKSEERKDVSSPTESFNSLWEKIDFSGLESIGFDKKHLLQIKNKTSPEIAQESINHFAFGLQYNKKTKEYTNPLATLISVLKRGEAWVEPNYQSSQELAQLKFLELKKAELARKKLLEGELYKVAFEEWHQNLSLQEKEILAPSTKKIGDMTPPLVKLSNYFKDNIWPEKKKDFLEK